MNKKPMRIVTLLVSLALTGCTLQPEYVKPTLPVKNNWNAQTSQGESVSSLDWKRFYSDKQLQTLIALALEHNRDLRVAALNVQTAQAQFRIERSALFPSIDGGVSKTAQHVPGNLYSTQATGAATYQQYQASIGVTSWELDFFGRLRSLKDNALESYLSSAATEEATRISLIAQVATSYLTLGADSDLLKLAKDTAKSQHDTYALVKYSYEHGSSTEQDLMQAEIAVRSAEADVEKYTRQVKSDLNALTLLLGTEAPAPIVNNASLKNMSEFPVLRAGLPSDLLTRRPDIIAAEHTLKAANANIGAARAAFFPSISLTASGGTTSSSLSNLFEGGTAAWSFTPSVNIPIFYAGRNKANLDVAKLSKEIEIANYEKSIQQAFKEVSDALSAKETYQNELSIRHKDYAASKTYYDLAQLRYQQGIDSYLNVLIAQRSYYSSQQNLISTLQGRFTQDITLYKALGGGW
ncbi:efflux transporter outer membrane subunit [Pectobacterium actinidiae]|uniref:Efflux transporter outer membrane subunit n=1 Tax=Pectobacterium actinidiae TaxID=1507808 RepID=A0ABW8GDL4_9GAMM